MLSSTCRWSGRSLAAVVLLFLLPSQRIGMGAAILMIALGIVYIALGPLFVKGVQVHKARKEAQAIARQDLT